MQAVMEVLVNQVLAPTMIAVLTAFGGWILTKIPGPLRDALG
jgi:hypothetical protein